MTREIVPIAELLEPDQLQQVELIQQLQLWLTEISTENFQTTLQLILDSVFIYSKDRVEQLARNIFFAARFRSMSIELLSDLVASLLSKSGNNAICHLKSFLNDLFFSKAFHDEYSYKETWRFFFLYQLFKRNIYSDSEIVDEIHSFYMKYSMEKKEIGLYKIMSAWFAPEIEKNAPDLFVFFTETPDNNNGNYSKNDQIDEDEEVEAPLVIFQGHEENETRVFDVLKNQNYTFEALRENNWSFYRKCRDFGYTIDPLVHCLMTDNDDELQTLSSSPNFDVETMIDPSLFSRSTILQDSTSPICFAAAVGSVKCFKFLILNQASLEYETWNEYSTTIAAFAVAGGSNEIVRLLNQKGCDFNEAIFVAVQYHRTDIFNWLFQLLNVDVEVKSTRYGTLLHRAAKSNNVTLSIFCMEHKCDVNKPVTNNDFFTDDKTPPLSEAIQFQAIDVAKLVLSHRDMTLVPQAEKQDSLVFELIYAHNHEIMPLFIRHKTFESALMREKPHFETLLKRCEEFNITELIDYFHRLGIDTKS